MSISETMLIMLFYLWAWPQNETGKRTSVSLYPVVTAMTTDFEKPLPSPEKNDAIECIHKLASAQYISPPYDVVVQSAISSICKTALPVHSIYVYGSVAEGRARPPNSDLDLTVVLNCNATDDWQPTIQTLQKELENAHPIVSSVDLPSVTLEEVMRPQSYYGWGYWFAVCCCCVHGDDLGRSFGPYHPSWKLAHGLNGDIEEVLLSYKSELSKSGTDVQKLCRGAARKILRSAFCLIMVEENSPVPSLIESRNVLIRYFPEQTQGFDLALKLAITPLNDAAAVLQMLDSIGAWVAGQFRTAPRE